MEKLMIWCTKKIKPYFLFQSHTILFAFAPLANITMILKAQNVPEILIYRISRLA
jgi:hypothetical protein